MKIDKICVYCASSPKVEKIYFDETEKLAKNLVTKGIEVILGGGSGTLEELLEAITLKRLGLFLKPIIILNINGFYNPLKEMLEKCVSENFMHKKHLEMWTFVNKPEDVLASIKNASDWDKGSICIATNRK